MNTRARIAAVAPVAILTWLVVGAAAPAGSGVAPARTVKVVLSEWKVTPLVWMTSALPFSARTSALRTPTTQSG